jgi:hypothetical protein
MMTAPENPYKDSEADACRILRYAADRYDTEV